MRDKQKVYLKSRARHISEETSLLREYAETPFSYRAWDTLLCMGGKSIKVIKGNWSYVKNY